MTLLIVIGIGMVAVALLLLMPALLGKSNSSDTADAVNQNVLRDQLRELEADRQAGTLDESAYVSAQQELQQQIQQQRSAPLHIAHNSSAIRSPWLALAIAVLMPALVLVLYLLLGNPAGLNPQRQLAPVPTIGEPQILAMVEKLAQRLRDEQGDIKGWDMLARSYFSLGRYAEAAAAYAHLVQLVPGNADYLTSDALSLALSQNKNLQGEPDQLLQRALNRDPKNIRALSLSGSAAFDRRDYAAAIALWNRVLALVPPESEVAVSTANSISEAQARSR